MTNLLVNLQTPYHSDVFAQSKTYRKNVDVTARVSSAGELLNTTLANGAIETTRVLEAGMMVVRNPGGEEFALSVETFEARYEPNNDGTHHSIGTVKAFKNPYGQPVTIIAPWGVEQYGDEECFFACSTTTKRDRYIIAAAEFVSTYVPIIG